MMIDMNWTFGFFKSEIIENFYDYWLIIQNFDYSEFWIVKNGE